MEIQHQTQRDTKVENVQQLKNQVQPNPAPPSPPSSSSSPSHEFSFTISLNPTVTKIPENNNNNKNKSLPPSFAIDLSPADEIFFHGHLLPLHLLSHISPRASTDNNNSTLPINEPSQQKNLNISDNREDSKSDTDTTTKATKSKPFSLFGLPSKWRKDEKDHEKKPKSKFDILKKYMRLVKPFLNSLKNRGENNKLFRQSYSGNLRVKSKKESRGRGRGFSAPATMRNSPTNSGRLVASGNLTPTSTSDSSTMEELQAAIQAAIAHCKKSSAMEDDRMKKMPS